MASSDAWYESAKEQVFRKLRKDEFVFLSRVYVDCEGCKIGGHRPSNTKMTTLYKIICTKCKTRIGLYCVNTEMCALNKAMIVINEMTEYGIEQR